MCPVCLHTKVSSCKMKIKCGVQLWKLRFWIVCSLPCMLLFYCLKQTVDLSVIQMEEDGYKRKTYEDKMFCIRKKTNVRAQQGPHEPRELTKYSFMVFVPCRCPFLFFLFKNIFLCCCCCFWVCPNKHLPEHFCNWLSFTFNHLKNTLNTLPFCYHHSQCIIKAVPMCVWLGCCSGC